MAFKRAKSKQEVAESPTELFRSLSRREFPTEMPHQGEIIKAYMDGAVDRPDVAIQLPTGSGKTWVGAMIGEWRRRKFGDRVVYLCPTKQLVHQTVTQCREKFGLDVIGFTGKKAEYNPSDVAEYRQGLKVGIATYNSLFNTNPFFHDVDTVIVDDAHTAENYIAGMWTLELDAEREGQRAFHRAVANVLKPHIGKLDYSILVGDVKTFADIGWVDKLPTPIFRKIQDELVEVIDEHVSVSGSKFAWSLLRENLSACHLYLSCKGILIRPIIPPTWTFQPFVNAKQRIYMSATLGEGGDLERLTGRESICRIPTPASFEHEAVGRRFFIFPGMSLGAEETEELRLELIKRARRAVILTPSQRKADVISKRVEEKLGFAVFDSDSIELSKQEFVSKPDRVAVLANRYDGIDFPKDECRLLCIDELPKAANAQELLFSRKMGAELLLGVRIQTRVMQAVGRCTRSLQDYSAVFVSGSELQDYLSDKGRREHFFPEFQAEIAFGVNESIGVDADDFIDNFDIFWEHKEDWDGVEDDIISAAKAARRRSLPAMDELNKAVVHEIKYQKALWNKDYTDALSAARRVCAELNASELRGYRALWHYLAGAAAHLDFVDGNQARKVVAEEQFRAAIKAAASLPWTKSLIPPREAEIVDEDEDRDLLDQVERLEAKLLGLGISTDRSFSRLERDVLEGLSTNERFEEAQVKLGELLGFIAGNDDSDGAPDPWWLSRSAGIVFEDHAGGEESTVLGAVKARQAAGHPKWLKENVSHASDCDLLPVIVSPVTTAASGAFPHLRDVAFWSLTDFVNWASEALSVIRRVKSTLPGACDLVWRAETAKALSEAGLSMKKLRVGCEKRMASDVLQRAQKK